MSHPTPNPAPSSPDAAPLISRRGFLRRAVGAGLGLVISGCATRDPLAHVTIRMVGPDAGTGHLLRTPGAIPVPTGPVETRDVVIVGGGISGLSALRHLRNSGRDAILLELEAAAGGNSVSGANAYSSYPWAAHYLPIPDARNTELLDFLHECGVVTGYRDGLPIYNEFHLCAAPEERLFIDGYWQEGLVPVIGLSAAARSETERFFRRVDELRAQIGSDGRDLFCIPFRNASLDGAASALDSQNFAEWLDREGFRSEQLRWYLDYCCLDDYGLRSTEVSAYAGLHYFAGRKGRGANAGHGDVLTWPEGNGYLMNALRRGNNAAIRTRKLVYRVEKAEGAGANHELWIYDAAAKQSGRIRCRELILACPHFVAARLLPQPIAAPLVAHTPWMVANLTLRQLPDRQGQGQGLSWDNVLYGTSSVGYVNARQQDPGFRSGPEVITFYKPLAGTDPQTARREALAKSGRAWLDEIVTELSTAHHDIAAQLLEADIRVWGHGMAGPLPGFRNRPATPALPHTELAHTDWSGISIFEEAFYQGLTAATAVMQRL